MSRLIAKYAEAVQRSLYFDRRSAQRLATEVEDHLCEALACDTSGPSDAAARRAIHRFGSPAEIAAVYTAQIFPERLKATWRSGLLLGALVVLTMWLRRTLDLLPQLDGLPGTRVLLFTDAIGFRIAIVLGVLAWLMSIRDRAARRAPSVVQALVAASAALCLSVAASLIVAAVAVVTTAWSMASLVAMGSTILAGLLMVLLLARIRMLRGYAALMTRGGERPSNIDAY